MFLYLSIIGVASFIITLLNSLFNQELFNGSVISIALIVVIGVILEIVLQGIVAFIAHSLPSNIFKEGSIFCKVSKRERKFYEKLHIRLWKNKVLELGFLSGFRKNKINELSNPDYFERFIIESNKGFLGHLIGIFFGFLILYYPSPNYWFCIGLPIAIVNVFLNVLPCMVLRYNIPKLVIAYERSKKIKELNVKGNFEDENK